MNVGELGGGKTTLLKHILSNRSNLAITAIVNDFAALNIDAALVRRTGPNQVVELSNGCMCCVASVGAELESAIWRSLNPDDISAFPDAIVIETSGVTDPTQIIARLDRKFGRTTRCRLDCVVIVVDAGDGVGTGGDVVVVNKIDLVGPDQVDSVCRRVNEVVPDVRILTSSFGRVPLRSVLDIDPDRVLGF